MAVKRFLREDEKDIDFGDTRETLIESWKNALELHQVKNADFKVIGRHTSHEEFNAYIREEQDRARRAHPWKRPILDSLIQLDRHLYEFEMILVSLAEQHTVDGDYADISPQAKADPDPISTHRMWGMVYLNVKLSIDSRVKLKMNAKWLTELRRNIELLNGVIKQCREQQLSDDNTLRMQLMEVFDPLMEVLRNSIDYLQSHYEDHDFRREWSEFDSEIKENLDSLFQTNRHLREVMATTKPNLTLRSNLAANTGNIKHRHAADDKNLFPVEVLPHARAEYFVGREEDLKRIHAVLGTETDNHLKTFTIYGRRGVGKTQLALEYARTQKKTYDAIFWVQCETRALLRQSFTTMAEHLELEGTSQNVNSFDENTMRVLQWLRHTTKRWLLIFDNAEREQAETLHQYLPNGSKGSMLLTSRSYYNFFDDAQRHGETVQPFTTDESRQLLMKQLGDEWRAEHLDNDKWMSPLEEAAINVLLDRTRGLPIAIFQAAKLILDPSIDKSRTARGFIQKFKDSYENLPKRHLGKRDDFIQALDAIWAIAFQGLTTHARTVLSILAFMSPDSILVDLFLPNDQTKLTGTILEFCRSASSDFVRQGPSIETVVKPSADLELALEELVNKGLINRNGRQISLHRTVREGLAYADTKWFRDCFSAAVSLMYDIFPQQNEGRPFTDTHQWCRTWIPHAVQLANQYAFLSKKRGEDEAPLMGMKSQDLLVSLLANCSWYLLEIADYDECLHIVSIARGAAGANQNTITYAHLLNTEGVACYEQNRLTAARSALEACVTIRREHCAHNSVDIANILNNLCNLETAEGNLEKALDFINEATKIYEDIGDPAAVFLALSAILTGRCHYLLGDYSQSYRTYQRAEGLLNKRVANNPYFTAHLHFCYGNLALKQEEYDAALREYDEARQIMKPLNPAHPLVAACLYKIACVEHTRDHLTKAIGFLERAYDIADVKSNGKVNGTILRILWKKSEVLLDSPFDSGIEEGTALRETCLSQQKVVAEELEVELEEVELVNKSLGFDRLVPGYFR